MIDRDISVGDYVIHFKNEMDSKENRGNYVYKVIAFAKDVETEVEDVVYQAMYGANNIWVRSKEDFFSKVDAVKYPNIKTEYRMTLITGIEGSIVLLNEYEELRKRMDEVYTIAYNEDIESPTIEAYKELHNVMEIILSTIKHEKDNKPMYDNFILLDAQTLLIRHALDDILRIAVNFNNACKEHKEPEQIENGEKMQKIIGALRGKGYEK